MQAIKKHLSKDPVLKKVLAMVGSSMSIEAWRLQGVAPESYFYYLSREITYQQLSGKAAGTIFGRLEVLVSQGHQDSQVPKSQPTQPTQSENSSFKPAKILEFTSDQLRAVGLSRAKAVYLHALAKAFIDGEINFAKFPEMDDESIIMALTSINGIGRWTAEMFLMFGMGRPDVFSFGDLGLRKAISLHYGFTKLPTAEEMKPIAASWSPYRTYASCVLWVSLDVM